MDNGQCPGAGAVTLIMCLYVTNVMFQAVTIIMCRNATNVMFQAVSMARTRACLWCLLPLIPLSTAASSAALYRQGEYFDKMRKNIRHRYMPENSL